MADIFISYAREDRDRIEKLAAALEGEGYSVWWDRNIGGGAEFSRVIEQELGSAKTVIVGWSEHSLGSHWVRDEADFARSANKLLPLSLDSVLPPLGFRQLHALDFSGWDETGADAVFKALTDSLGAAPRRSEKKSPAKTPAAKKSARPGVAVLPFVNMSTDEEIEYLADGLTEDIITMLSSNRQLSVAARTSTFAYKGQQTDVRAVGEALGARYVVEGSVRKIGSRARMTVQFIAAESGAHLWAAKYDQSLEELYESPDDMAEKISGGLFAQLTYAEAERALRTPAEALGAWEYCLRAFYYLRRGYGSVKTLRSGFEELKRAIELEPDFGSAHALMSMAANTAIIYGLYEDGEFPVLLEAAKTHLRRARELAQDDLMCLLNIGNAEMTAGQHDRSVNSFNRVIARNPAFVDAWSGLGTSLAFLGRFDEARAAMERAIALSSKNETAQGWLRGQVELLAGAYDKATPQIEAFALDEPGFGYVNIVAALCASMSGEDEKAKRFIDKAKEHNPQLRPEKLAPMVLSQSDKDKGEREYALLQKLWGGDGAKAAAPAAQTKPAAKTSSVKPSIAVLPFANMSADKDVEYLADGLTEDIITSLSAIQHFSVAARTTTFAYKGQSADIRDVGEALGARYVVEGSVRKMGKRARVTVQFIAVETGAHIWAKKFDQSLDDLYESSDDLVQKISGSLSAQMTVAEAERSERAPPGTLGAWEYCQRAAATIGRSAGSIKELRRIIGELEKAVKIEPDYALAHAILSWGSNAAIINGMYEDDELADCIARAKQHLRRARELANNDLLTLTYIGASENFAGMQERALHTLENVLARNPASAEAWYIICQVYSYRGRYDDARKAIERARELAPEAGFSLHHDWYRGLTEFIAGEYERAAKLIERHVLQVPEYGYAQSLAAICADQRGDEAAARKFIAKAKEHNSQLRPEKLAGMILTQPDKEKGQREYAILEKLWAAPAP